jgi:hypothetical protein
MASGAPDFTKQIIIPQIAGSNQAIDVDNTVTVSVDVPQLYADIIEDDTVAGDTAWPYTVPADHELLLYGVYVYAKTQGALAPILGYVGIFDEADAIQYYLFYQEIDVNLYVSWWHMLPIPVTLEAGWYVQVTSAAAALSLSCTIFGKLKSA